MIALKAMWAVLWSVPTAIVWMMLYGLLYIGWGIETADRFILHWNAFTEQSDFRIPTGEDG